MLETFCKYHPTILLKPIGLGKHRRVRCPKCNTEAVTKRRKQLKVLLVDYFGGKCVLCSYDKCISALEFHHLDPNEKEFSISVSGNTRALYLLIEEAKKCILVCANCHREIHALERE